MKTALALLALLTTFVRAEIPKPDRVIKLWERQAAGRFHGARTGDVTQPKPTDKPPILRLTNIAEPRLEIYEPPRRRRTAAAVIVVPGGGFGILASGHEGAELRRLVSRPRLRRRRAPAPLPDEQAPAAVGIPRAGHAARDQPRARQGRGIRRASRIASGFSVSPRAARSRSSPRPMTTQRLYPAADAIDKASCRPDFLMLCYPWKILADDSLTELKPEVRINAQNAADLHRPSQRRQRLARRRQHARLPRVAQSGRPRRTAHLRHGRPRLRPAARTARRRPATGPGAELWLKARGLMAK